MLIRKLHVACSDQLKCSEFMCIKGMVKFSHLKKIPTFICCAAFSSSSPAAVAAFDVACHPRRNFLVKSKCYRTQFTTPVVGAPSWERRKFSSLFGRNWNTDGEKKGTFLSNLLDKAKEVGSKYLPAVFGQPSKQQRKKEIVRREIDETVGALFQNTPFGTVGKAIIRPLLQTMASTFEEQAESVQQVVDQAKAFILRDDRLTRRLTGGDGAIQTTSPFSQSSSTTSINGRRTSEIGVSFQVFGRGASGVATVLARNGAITSLYVVIDGVKYNVDPSTLPSSSVSDGLGNINDNIIDAEFVEKK